MVRKPALGQSSRPLPGHTFCRQWPEAFFTRQTAYLKSLVSFVI